MTEWKPIEQAAIEPFNERDWFMSASPRYLLLRDGGKGWTTGHYSYTRKGKGRWKDVWGTVCEPTHFAEVTLPE
jgi:hypothetical protein